MEALVRSAGRTAGGPGPRSGGCQDGAWGKGKGLASRAVELVCKEPVHGPQGRWAVSLEPYFCFRNDFDSSVAFREASQYPCLVTLSPFPRGPPPPARLTRELGVITEAGFKSRLPPSPPRACVLTEKPE